jgi:nucleotide-binding universal stress UspA family protein
MRVLIALDDSEQAEIVVDALAPWLRRSEADVHLASVVDMSHVKAAARAGQPAYEPAAYEAGMRGHVEQPPPRAAETHGQALERARTEREEALIRLARDSMEGLDVTVHVITDDDTAGAIAKCGVEVGADVVAVGTHGRSGLTQVLMGSVAQQVVRRSELPVLVVRAGMHTWALGGASE